MAPRCSPPKSVSVGDYWRRATRRKSTPRPGTYTHIVQDDRTGETVSRHKSFTAAVAARKRLDLASYRRGQGRPFSTRKAR